MFLGLFVFAANAQRVTVDTLNGVGTVNFEKLLWPGSIQAHCEELSGTSDGTLRLQASLDGEAWQYVSETDGLANFYPNDTLTVTNGAVLLVNITKKAFPYWRIVGTGTADDVTKVTIKYYRQ